MARGIYSALGHWPEAELPRVVEMLRAIGDEVTRGVGDAELGATLSRAAELGATLSRAAREAVIAAFREIRIFEARVGQATGLDAEIVRTPTGPAIELGNRGHVGFGVTHEEAAAVVAQELAELMKTIGATGVFWFTTD